MVGVGGSIVVGSGQSSLLLHYKFLPTLTCMSDGTSRAAFTSPWLACRVPQPPAVNWCHDRQHVLEIPYLWNMEILLVALSFVLSPPQSPPWAPAFPEVRPSHVLLNAKEILDSLLLQAMR